MYLYFCKYVATSAHGEWGDHRSHPTEEQRTSSATYLSKWSCQGCLCDVKSSRRRCRMAADSKITVNVGKKICSRSLFQTRWNIIVFLIAVKAMVLSPQDTALNLVPNLNYKRVSKNTILNLSIHCVTNLSKWRSPSHSICLRFRLDATILSVIVEVPVHGSSDTFTEGNSCFVT